MSDGPEDRKGRAVLVLLAAVTASGAIATGLIYLVMRAVTG